MREQAGQRPVRRVSAEPLNEKQAELEDAALRQSVLDALALCLDIG